MLRARRFDAAVMKVPFSPPDIRQEDIDAVVDVLRSGWITTGPVSRQFEAALAAYMGVHQAVTVNSCTAALELALRALGVGPGDEVIVPAYTYTASAAVVEHVGAQVVLVDTAPGEYRPDIPTILAAVTERTKAVIVVDIAGVPFPADDLRTALEGSRPAGRLGVLDRMERPAVIVDGAHSLGATRKGMRAGQLGDFTAFSFHAVKNLTTGEGGALCWRPDLEIDDDVATRLVRRLSLHGQTKDALAKTQAGQWEYDIIERGYKSNMPDILAALGLSQLGRYDEMLATRRGLIAGYADGLAGLATVLPHAGTEFLSSAHLAMVDLGALAPHRQQIINHMAEAGISTNVHYKPLPLLTAYRSNFDIVDFPNAHAQYLAELTLPLHTLLTDESLEYVIASFREAVERAA
ncbi:dTDP-4-amino-4,6-dideoxygalactose transaminase [Tessaracoccus oleiagri]|uniref:dTDP-4-amino-4,6-dideoxygalactose transaminase n=2 Tax=Tessaracoccus oleiagri TaxID=686624 RepID=A0A1G9KFS9_9ACTN|nr:dTDP-4-amino-4,6-dideoxygalactose transaminase [Tessaracoccus oleiagri]